MTSRTLLATTALVFIIGGSARAAELSTPTMVASATALWCNIVNISSVVQTVRIRAYNESGTITADSGDVVVGTRATLWQSVSNGRGHCRFTTVNSKTLFRASINVYDGGTVIESLPAQ